MTQAERLSRQEAFVRVHRRIDRLREFAAKLAVQLESDPDAQFMFDAERAGADYHYLELDWDHVWGPLQALEESLRHDVVQAIKVEAVDWIEEAFEHIKEALPNRGQRGGDPRVLGEAVDWLWSAVHTLDDYCYKKAAAVFGLWGAYWFTVATGRISNGTDIADLLGQGTVAAEELVRIMDSPAKSESEQDWSEAIEARDQWVYEQVMGGMAFPSIIRELKSKPIKWRRISSKQGIKAAARRYADKHELPMPEPRPPGRPSGT